MASRAKRSIECRGKGDMTSFRVTLDDAVDALTNVKVDDHAMRSFDTAPRKVFGSGIGKRRFQEDYQGKGFPRNIRNKSRIPNGEGPKASSKFRECGEPNRWYKDP